MSKNISIRLKNPETDKIKEIKLGFNFIFFFFSATLGIPLFLNKLHKLGCLFLIVNLLYIINPYVELDLIIFSPLYMVLSTWIGVTGNKKMAKNYIKNGWEFINPESENVHLAKKLWNI